MQLSLRGGKNQGGFIYDPQLRSEITALTEEQRLTVTENVCITTAYESHSGGDVGQNEDNFFHYGIMAIKRLIAEKYLSVFLQSVMEEEGRSRQKEKFWEKGETSHFLENQEEKQQSGEFSLMGVASLSTELDMVKIMF